MDLLLVEDDIDLQKVLAQYLELSGFNVYTANHGKPCGPLYPGCNDARHGRVYPGRGDPKA